MLDYMTLKIIWWGLMCFLVIAYAVTGGMDIGVQILLPIIAKSDDDRRLVLNSIGPTWEGNQVWLITIGAGMFAIWPIAYGTIFSSMYYAFLLVLIMLILRPPGIDYRAKINSHAWRRTWDLLLFVSSFTLAISFGIAIGNLFTGLPFYFDMNLRQVYTGDFFSVFTPVAFIFGIVSLCMMVTQGSIFLQYKLGNDLATRARKANKIAGFAFMVTFIAAGVYVSLGIPGYHIDKIPDLNLSFLVTNKVVTPELSGWLNNYVEYKVLWLLPFFALIFTRVAIKLCENKLIVTALIINSLAIVCTVLTAACALFPFIMPSRINPSHSLTIWDVSSSKLTLAWSLAMVIIFVPMILMYTTWVYRVMRGKVEINKDSY